MTTNDHIKLLYPQLQNYSKVAKIVGCSRQYVHRVIANYKNTGRFRREEKYKNMGMCVVCDDKKATCLHHIDGDNTNDKSSNLQALCSECHQKAHMLLRYNNNIPKKCGRCDKKFTEKRLKRRVEERDDVICSSCASVYHERRFRKENPGYKYDTWTQEAKIA